jgi:uncharacterized protein YkwD
MHVRAYRRASRIGILVLSLTVTATVAWPAAAGARPVRGARAACPGAYTSARSLTSVVARHSTLCLINRLRRRHGLRPLRPARSLRVAATGFAAEMVRQGFFAHVGPDGRDLVARLRSTGFIRRDVAWSVGENLGWGVGAAARPVEIVRAWMRSGPHRQNLMGHGFRQIGIGVDLGVPAASAAGPARERGGATYVVDLGVRRRP